MKKIEGFFIVLIYFFFFLRSFLFAQKIFFLKEKTLKWKNKNNMHFNFQTWFFFVGNLLSLMIFRGVMWVSSNPRTVWRENLLVRETVKSFPFQTVKISFFKLSKISFSNCQKFPFSNCQKFPFQTVKNFLFKLSKNFLFKLSKFPLQTVKIFLSKKFGEHWISVFKMELLMSFFDDNTKKISLKS